MTQTNDCNATKLWLSRFLQHPFSGHYEKRDDLSAMLETYVSLIMYTGGRSSTKTLD